MAKPETNYQTHKSRLKINEIQMMAYLKKVNGTF